MEAVPGYPNLHRRNGTYYLYKRVPKALLEAYEGKPFIRRSLRTKDFNEAKVRLHRELVDLDEEFSKVRTELAETITPKEAKDIAEGRLKDLLIEVMEQREEGNKDGAELFSSVKDQVAKLGGVTFTNDKEASSEFGLSEREYRQKQDNINRIRPHYRSANARQDLGAVSEDVDVVSEEHHLRLHRGSDGWRCLAREMLNMWVQYFDIVEKRQNGEPIEFNLTPPPYSPQEAQGWTRATPSVVSEPSISLRSLVDRYVNDPSRNASKRTNESYEVIFRTMRDVIGAEKDLNAITREDCRNVMNALIKTPVNAAQRFPGSRYL